MKTKNCGHCKETKETTEFYKCPSNPDGIRSWCKLCTSLYNRSRKDYQNNLVRRLYRENPLIRLRQRELSRRRPKEKRTVIGKVKYALEKGWLVKKLCEVCGDKKSLAHHMDYSRPLDVIWLCPSHHRRFHIGDTDTVKLVNVLWEKISK